MGPAKAVGILVGEGPGREEAEQGKPFVGATGQALDEELMRAGLIREQLRIVNATLCQPTQPKKEAEMAAAVQACRPAFIAQLKRCEAPVLAMGKWSAVALTGRDKGVLNARGFIRWDYRLSNLVAGGPAFRELPPVVRRGRVDSFPGPSKENTTPLIITWHPTYAIFRQPYEWGAFRLDMERFVRVIKGTTRPGPKRLIIEPTVSDVASMAAEPFSAVDIETGPRHWSQPWTGKDPTRAFLRTIAFGTPDWAFSLDCTHNHVHVRREIKKLLADKTKLKVFHNGDWFDKRVLRRFDMPVRNTEDTRDMRRALSATSPLSLRYVTSLYLDWWPWKETEQTDDDDFFSDEEGEEEHEKVKDNMKSDGKEIIFTKDLVKLRIYNAIDTIVTARDYVAMREEMLNAK